MPWKASSLIEERLRFVKLVLRAREAFTDLCRRFGISRTAGYKWKGRFLDRGRRGLQDGSRRPHRAPQQIRPRWIDWIRRLRLRHRSWGARKIDGWLSRRYPRTGLPSERTIATWLQRMKLVPGRRRRRRGPWLERAALTQPQKPNEVWTIDFKGWFRTGDGQRIEPLTVRDLFSRYGLAVHLLRSQRWQPVRGVMAGLFRRYGLPEVIRVDNGTPFGSTGPAGLSRLSAWWTGLGIRVEFIEPGHPEQNGAHEQFHRVLKRETARPPARSARAQQRRSRLWRIQYNQVRPHEALGQRVPASVYRRSPRSYPPPRKEWKYPAHWSTRRVRTNGEVKWQGRKRFLGEAFVGTRVGLQPLRPGVYAVYFRQVMLGQMHATDVSGLRPTAYARRRLPASEAKV